MAGLWIFFLAMVFSVNLFAQDAVTKAPHRYRPEQVFCNESKSIEECDGQRIKIAGSINREAASEQHPLRVLPGEEVRQMYVDTSLGRFTVVAKDKIDCEGMIEVVGALDLPKKCIPGVKSDCERVVTAETASCQNENH